jgi:hypothetical protein
VFYVRHYLRNVITLDPKDRSTEPGKA